MTLTALTAHGTLTGGTAIDTIYTAGTATPDTYFSGRFINTSGGSVTYKAWMSGTVNQNLLTPTPIQMDAVTQVMVVVKAKLGSADYISAQAGTSGAVVWTYEVEIP